MQSNNSKIVQIKLINIGLNIGDFNHLNNHNVNGIANNGHATYIYTRAICVQVDTLIAIQPQKYSVEFN